MKKLPLTLIPIAFFIILTILFAFVVPEGQDLISPIGDAYIGQANVYLFILCLILDIIRFFNRNKA